MVLLLGIFAYGESFGDGQLVVFGFIWLGLVVYSIPGIRGMVVKSRA
jgi:chloramphenicol-sensitive protein RarD